ncbi:MAG: acyl-CoA dehydratase activase-related protein [Opitutae bacterium]|nr:acyl-CoA dehydratase activase-related protein [Opitutae bacterium]
MVSKTVFSAGLDVGSTTLKFVVCDSAGDVVYSEYRRHHADIFAALRAAFENARAKLGDSEIALIVTGSAGMGVAERSNLPFVQEVVASAEVIRQKYPATKTFIDIGGEDAKMIFFEEGKSPDIRMNGSCAGGTGAFIDQMATLLGRDVSELSALAEKATRVHPIASRCGVFSKTDIQNLLARGTPREEIASSIFHAVALQCIGNLARGFDILPQVFFCGGPFAFIPALRKAFRDELNLTEEQCVYSENAAIIPAWGCALTALGRGDEARQSAKTLSELEKIVMEARERTGGKLNAGALPRLFNDKADFDSWKIAHSQGVIPEIPLSEYDETPCFLGIDSGSTTTKIAVMDSRERLLFSFYKKSQGDALGTAQEGLNILLEELEKLGKKISIARSCVTGYGEDLVKAAFNLDAGIVETIAHYRAARKFKPDVSFILDIGGQDMKAVFVENGAINRLEINEACSSGCGSFVEAFAGTLKYKVSEFANIACFSESPSDLGTRCTVFMNSKVKQCLREGAAVADIAAGLSFSIIKNCLHKVLKIRDMSELGDHVVVQGGTFRNLSVVRAFEILTGKTVVYTNMPEMMGAYGCALYAKETFERETAGDDNAAAPTEYRFPRLNSFSEKRLTCPGCTNRCTVSEFLFENGNTYFSGNKCEKIFTNKGAEFKKGENMYTYKYARIFKKYVPEKRVPAPKKGKLRIGIPRALNQFENYQFWSAFLTECGCDVVLSSTSTVPLYEKGLHSVMSDNICFPAKITHGHVLDLVRRKVDRIFIPYVVRERKEDKEAHGSFNCPIVSGYGEVIKSAMETERKYGIPTDVPVFTFAEEKLLRKACLQYAETLGVRKRAFRKAFSAAIESQRALKRDLSEKAKSILDRARSEGRMVILLAGRPYHSDPLIQHKISDMAADFGVDIITEDIVRFADEDALDDINGVLQWTYVTRILKAARFVANSTDSIHYVQMTSFGCGPDAFIIDEASDILRRGGKNITILKIDDVNNIGSLKLRLRSLIESLKFKNGHPTARARKEIAGHTAIFREADRDRTILYPYISEYLSPIIKPALESAGYKAEMLPPSDEKTIEFGLKHSNNEICYPATLCVGDIVKALESGKYDRNKIAVGISQTGGQCRATNYLGLIKKALAQSGFSDVPVVALGVGTSPINEQPGMAFSLTKIASRAVSAIVYGDCIAQMYYSTVVREQVPGTAAQIRDNYLAALRPCVRNDKVREMFELLARAAGEFEAVPTKGVPVPAIGIVGEIYVKYNSFSHKNVVSWLVEQGVEPVVPNVTDFMIQDIVNNKTNTKQNLARRSLKTWGFTFALRMIANRAIVRADRACRAFSRYRPFGDIREKARRGAQIVNLAAQFGEGWLIPAEFAGFAEHGVFNAVSMQPFGCIANHIVAKGIEKRVKRIYPKMNLLFLDFDSGTSEANVLNRLHFMIKNAREQLAETVAPAADKKNFAEAAAN